MTRDLVVIESPGKVKTLHRVFGEIGLHADVCATIGHFLENPASLKDLAIEYRDGEFVETKRKPYREDSYRYLCDQLRKCTGRVIVATDNDQEGHVIAQDVADLSARIAPDRTVLRMVFGGLDRNSLIRALSDLRPIETSKAVPGTARRVADRIIGACMSDFERNRPVGRVQSALLGVCDRGLAHTEVRVSLPCADAGKPFIGSIPLCGNMTPAKLIAQLDTHDVAPAPVARSEMRALNVPLTYGAALIDLHQHLHLDIGAVADLLQRMYEAGDISYPRTSSHGLTEAGIESVARLARLKGLIAFKRDLLPRLPPNTPHEAIRVLNEVRLRSLEINKPLKLHDNDRDAALSFIARRTLEAGMVIQRDYPDTSNAPAWVKDVTWCRDTRRTVLPWRYPERPEACSRDIKAALVEAMVDNGIGRPSTYASHAAKFSERELVDYKFDVTAKGRDWLESAPAPLKSVETSARIEAVLESEDRPVAELVEEVLEMAAGNDAAALEAIYAQLEVAQDARSEDEDIEDPELRCRPAF